ncbi:hypothetical protein NMY22_g12625 [Coprinellus aureogranulatus]|nr:hypothetical protein NMY22_g12625 [Coprinellus aureogranulatus]
MSIANTTLTSMNPNMTSEQVSSSHSLKRKADDLFIVSVQGPNGEVLGTATKPRKPRKDKGVPRGPRKAKGNTSTSAAPTQPSATPTLSVLPAIDASQSQPIPYLSIL